MQKKVIIITILSTAAMSTSFALTQKALANSPAQSTTTTTVTVVPNNSKIVSSTAGGGSQTTVVDENGNLKMIDSSKGPDAAGPSKPGSGSTAGPIPPSTPATTATGMIPVM